MQKSKSSAYWLNEHFSDKYVKQSSKDGYYARSAYKLLEIDKKYGILKSGITVVDLGAAPGSWSQVAAEKVKTGKIFALDLLPIKFVTGIVTIRGDFRDELVLNELVANLKSSAVDLILSDMAPNFSGHKAVDIPRAMHLVELTMDFASQTLNQSGNLVSKIFHGEGFDEIINHARKDFKKVAIYKPDSSRGRSKEVYVVCKDKTTKPLYNGQLKLKV